MILTKEAASGKMCPVVSKPSEPALCTGFNCMAWRPVNTPGGEKGYCGMAGVPATVQSTIQVEALRQLHAQESPLVLPS